MATFTVQLLPRAKKHLWGLDDKTLASVEDALLEMEVNPYSGDHKKLQGGGGHRRRIGRYRILYDVDTDLRLVTVYGVVHRKDAYR